MAKQEYVQKNREWLQAKAAEPGVMPIDKGIYYKVLSKGKPDAPKPSRNSVVVVHYTGKTINGKTFDSSRGGHTTCNASARTDPGVDYRASADARR